jgi:hypothetical protein
MPRQVLGTVNKGNTYHFPAGARNTGTVNIEFPNTANQHSQTTIVVATANGGQFRRDKLAAGSTRVAKVGMYDHIASIQNVGPSSVQLSLSW